MFGPASPQVDSPFHSSFLAPSSYFPGIDRFMPEAHILMVKDQLTADLKEAMRAKDAVRLRTIRSLRAALLEKEIAERTGGEAELTEAQEQAVLQKQAKQRRDAIEQYEAAGREDLAAKEREELAVIETYLPEQLDDEAIRTVITALIAETGATSMRDIGKVMGPAVQKLKGRADGRRINEIVRALLAG